MADFKTRLKKLMEEKGLKAPTLSKLAGISDMSIYRYLNTDDKPYCTACPSADALERLCDVFDVSMDYLWGRSDKR